LDENSDRAVNERQQDLCMENLLEEHMPLYHSTRPENGILDFIGLGMCITTR
jgi:hypothetical protein